MDGRTEDNEEEFKNLRKNSCPIKGPGPILAGDDNIVNNNAEKIEVFTCLFSTQRQQVNVLVSHEDFEVYCNRL